MKITLFDIILIVVLIFAWKHYRRNKQFFTCRKCRGEKPDQQLQVMPEVDPEISNFTGKIKRTSPFLYI